MVLIAVFKIFRITEKEKFIWLYTFLQMMSETLSGKSGLTADDE